MKQRITVHVTLHVDAEDVEREEMLTHVIGAVDTINTQAPRVTVRRINVEVPPGFTTKSGALVGFSNAPQYEDNLPFD